MKIEIILEPDLSVTEIQELGLLAESCGIHGLWVQNYSSAMDPFMSLVPLTRVREFAATGLDELALRIHDDPADTIRLIGEHIVPALDR